MQSNADLNERLGGIADEISDHDVQLLQRTVLGKRAARRRRRSGGAMLVGAVAAAGVVAALNVTGVVGASQGDVAVSARPAALGPDGDFTRIEAAPGEPCAMAREVSISAISAETDAKIFMPNAEEASAKRLSGSWLCGSTPALAFGPNIRIFYETGWSNVDVESKFAELAKDYGGHVTAVRDVPALFQAAATEDAMSQVLLVSGDVLIRVQGSTKVPEQALLNIASSMDLSKPMQ